MGFKDQWYERQAGFRLAIALTITVASFACLAWMVAAAWFYIGALGALVVLLCLALEFGVTSAASFASRRGIRLFAAIFLAFSTGLLAAGFTPVGVLGVLGTLAFFACDFAMHRSGRLRIEGE